jgi:hypothetical protein
MVTTRTTESIRPAQIKKVFTASLIGGEPLFQFLSISWIILHGKEHYILWLRQSSEYPNNLIRILSGSSKTHQVPELWDGRTARRVVASILRLLSA